MSIHKHDHVPAPEHPGASEEERAEAARHVSGARRGNWFSEHRGITAATGAVAAIAVAGAVGVGLKGGGNKAPEGKKDTPSLVTGPDGTPLQYVEYSPQHKDRNGDGFNDAHTDVNKDNVNDAEELWDQQTKEFVDPQGDAEQQNKDALASATPEQINDIEEIGAKYPEIVKDDPRWMADFVKLSAKGRLYVMTVLRNPQDFKKNANGETISDLEAETSWKASILGGIKGTLGGDNVDQ